MFPTTLVENWQWKTSRSAFLFSPVYEPGAAKLKFSRSGIGSMNNLFFVRDWRSRTKAVIIIILKLALAVSELLSINLSISNHLWGVQEGEKPYIS